MRAGESPLRIAVAVLVLVSALQTGNHLPANAQASEPTNVDLAAVPAFPWMLQETGFQVLQAGHLDAFSFQYGVSSSGGYDDADWKDVAGHYRQGYSMLLGRLSNPADPQSTPVAYFLTYIIEWDSDASALAARETLLRITQPTGSTQYGPVTASTSPDGISAIGTYGRALVWTTYSVSGPDTPPAAPPGVWTEQSLTAINTATAERLATATTGATTDPGLAQAALRISGPNALGSIAWAYYPTSDVYRVLDGTVVPAPGEATVPTVEQWPGVEDMFFSRQTLGANGYDYVIESSLARFASPEQATAYAAHPAQSTIPSRLIGDITVMGQVDRGDGIIRQQVQAAGQAPVPGYRTIRVSGNVVQVVTMLGSGAGVVTEASIDIVTNAQMACLDALPSPCRPLPQDQMGIPLSATEPAA